MVTLRDADGRAVDLVLDRAATAQDRGATLFAGQPGVSNEQVAAVEKVLGLLHVIETAEPSPDLVRRTLERIDADAAALLPVDGGIGFGTGAGQPVA